MWDRQEGKGENAVTSHKRRVGLLLASLVVVVGIVVVLNPAADSALSPSVGRVPESAFTPNGIDIAQVPDYVPALDQQGDVAGYVRKEDILPTDTNVAPSDGPVPVVDRSLERVVGHMHPGRGFVPLGQSPDDVPALPVTTIEIGSQTDG